MMSFWKRYSLHLETLFVFLLAAAVRLTDLGVFRVVDEEDRWAWAVDFYQALLRGDLPATLVGDGYPGIFPVWLETGWLMLASLYRSALQGGWLGDDGIYLLIHEWGRWSNLALQRFPVALVNTLMVVGIFLYARKLFGRRVALLGAILISLDPFYLSDSRVNRAEALLTGLMSLSLLALIVAQRWSNRRQFVASAVFGGLAWLTKSQALVLLPMFGVISLLWSLKIEARWLAALKRAVLWMLGWTGLAGLTFLLLWPATWTVPGPTFGLMGRYLTRKVGEEGVKLFFLGQTVLNEDPGLLFYPVIFLLRVTPLALIGLLIGAALLVQYARAKWGRPWRAWFDERGMWAVLAYVLLYVGGMSLGSHKQDRFLMSVFPALDLLAALSFVTLVERWRWPARQVWVAGAAMLALQLITMLPFHPYYFSYFNPLAGGGPAATRLTRIGWGEGMDQVADYLNSLDNPNNLTVATRFYKYLLGFDGTPINLGADGEWLQADKIVFYIQQSQRMLDPSPGLIRYFQDHVPPEKTITINRIEYAQIYPNPITYPANPHIDRVEGAFALFGYRWEEDGVRLIWENLGGGDEMLGVRLWVSPQTQSVWQICQIAEGFKDVARIPGEVIESICPLEAAGLEPGLYNLQLGLQQAGVWQPIDFAAGQAAIEIAADGSLRRVAPQVAFARLADAAIPPSATRLERAYGDSVRLPGFELSAETGQPGDTIDLTLYWQAVQPIERDLHVTIQAFVGDERIALLNGPPNSGPTSSWQPGQIVPDRWTISIPSDALAPARVRLDVGLFRPDMIRPLQAQNLEREDVPGAITTMHLTPETWPAYSGDHPLTFTFGEAVTLTGYDLDSEWGLTLYWHSEAPLDEDLTAFVHLLKPDGTLAAQSDVVPEGGRYPTSAWQPGQVVLSYHRLSPPSDLPPGAYTLVAGLYRPGDWVRLAVSDAEGNPVPDNAAPLEQITVR